MAEVVTMPRLSDTMEEGTVAKWLKKVGDKVEEGEILAEIETDKATMEFESFYNGTLLHIGIPEGDGAPVDALLAIIGDEGEDISALLGGAATPASASSDEVKPVEAASAPANETKVVASIPVGVEIVTMPRLSDTMEEGTVASWLKKVGDSVEEGDILAEIETDKATMEFESFYSGTLLHIGIGEGGSAPVDSVLAIIGPAGTDVSSVLSGAAAPAAAAPAAPKEAVEVKSETLAAASVVAAPVLQTTEITPSNGRIFASPLAKKLAKEKGLDLSTVKGSGEHGRIIRRDVEQAQAVAAPAVSTAAQPVATPVVAASRVENKESVKNSQMRKVIAKRLSESKFTAPHYYLTVEVEMDEAKVARQQINQLPDTKVSFNDMVLKASAMALLKHKQVNTTWSDEATIINHHVHLGVAVAVEDGLVVPVIKHADQLSFTQLGATVKDMAGRARNKKLTPAEMEGSTFTVSNLGMFGIEEFTAIINPPDSCILAVGGIKQVPVVKNGNVVPGNVMKVTLSCDHRVVDGATGAAFLQTLKGFLENPVTMLV